MFDPLSKPNTLHPTMLYSDLDGESMALSDFRTDSTPFEARGAAGAAAA